jgi:hypothetical protein
MFGLLGALDGEWSLERVRRDSVALGITPIVLLLLNVGGIEAQPMVGWLHPEPHVPALDALSCEVIQVH